MHEGFCKAFGFVKTQQHAAEYLQDGRGVQGRKRQKRSIGNNCVAVGVEVGAIGAEGLKRSDSAGADIFSVRDCISQEAISGFRQSRAAGQKAGEPLCRQPDRESRPRRPLHHRQYALLRVLCLFYHLALL